MMDKTIYRTHLTDQVDASLKGQEIILNGWVHKRRDHGGIIFIDLRDSKGLIQLVFDPAVSQETYKIAETLRSEYVLSVKGKISLRSNATINKDLPTGEVEIFVDKMTVLNSSKPLPFSLDDYDQTNEETRLKYRYLDLRKTKTKSHFIKKAEIMHIIRNFLVKEGLTELETPILTKATPEGARDFLVPSRIQPGQFYALPQSPQIFKQLFMVAGFNGYYQVARCFRDEDLRADRQPEFTQLDMEFGFAYQDSIIETIERLFTTILKEAYNKTLKLPIRRMTYKDAMTQYGTDRPDLRFDLKLVNIEKIAKSSEFSVFNNALKSDGIVYGINVKNGANLLSRKDIDNYTQYVSVFGAKGLAYMKVTENGLESNITKFFSEADLKELQSLMSGEAGDLLFFVADKPSITFPALGNLRNKLAQDLDLIKDKSELNFLWIVDFPLFEWSDTDNRYTSTHHPFTSPHPEDLELLKERKLGEVRALAHDLVLNGIEIGGGSIRIHDSQLQHEMFEILKLSEEDIKNKFGFFIEALQYGTPPHGGIAFGIDRVIMMLQGLSSIRDVITFPKTQKGQCLLSDSPSPLDEAQLKELHIKTIAKKDK